MEWSTHQVEATALPRTLRHYDRIGLLSSRTSWGLQSTRALIRLQQIWYYANWACH